MNVFTKGFEFVWILYGSQYSGLVVLMLFVCQNCACCTVFDYDWIVVKGQKLRGWYCAKCGRKCCQDPMNGAIAVHVRGRAELSFITRLDIPTGSLSNLAAFLKWIKFLVNRKHESPARQFEQH